MNIVKNKILIRNILDSLQKNYFKFFLTIGFLVLVTFIVAIIVIFYCEIFYKYSDLAKDRILNNPKYALIITPALLMGQQSLTTILLAGKRRWVTL